MRAMVMLIDGALVGIAGVARWTSHGCYEFFSDLKPESRELLKCPTVIRHLLRIKPWIRECRLPVYAVAQADEPNAERLLAHFGFRHETGALFKWQS